MTEIEKAGFFYGCVRGAAIGHMMVCPLMAVECAFHKMWALTVIFFVGSVVGTVIAILTRDWGFKRKKSHVRIEWE